MLVLGIDIGTSGVRAAAVDHAGKVRATAHAPHAEQASDRIDAEAWWAATQHCLRALGTKLIAVDLDPDRIEAVAVDGTSGTMVLVDANVRPVTRALMYDSSGFTDEAAQIAAGAPEGHITRGSNSALARLLRLQAEDHAGHAVALCHQADFILARLAGEAGRTDFNNALKTGFDPATGTWPAWFESVGVRVGLLPDASPPGTDLTTINAGVAAGLGLSRDLRLRAGTTDSVAAFLATDVAEPGIAVTSLGTTLALKILSPARIEAPEIGLYSHRIGDMWLAGGASNSGGGVLLDHFTPAELTALSLQIDPDRDSGLDYYPLSRRGERFPVNDPDLAPRLTPRPDDDVRFLHGLLEGIARIEARGYRTMAECGAMYPRRVLTAGGGSKNPTWRRIRERILGVPVEQAIDDEACVGAARLCLLPNGLR